jgi:hypothetical protein
VNRFGAAQLDFDECESAFHGHVYVRMGRATTVFSGSELALAFMGSQHPPGASVEPPLRGLVYCTA